MALGSPQWMYSSGSYEIDQSLKFDNSRSQYLSRTPAANGNRRTWTLSYWIKRSSTTDFRAHFGGSLSGSASVGVQILFDGGTQQLLITDYRAGYNVDWSAKSNKAFRDVSGWYHIVIAVDTTQSTASNRVKLYANGELLSLTTYNAPSQNFDTKFNQNNIQVIGCYTDNESPTGYYEGYMAEINFLDGIVATPSDFGETGSYGEWKPKEYNGSYGTNGYYLPMKADYSVEGFSTITWKGNDAADHYIGGAGFKPSLTWLKPRSVADHNLLYDRARGYSSQIKSNSANAEDITSKVLPATDGILLTTTDQNQNSSSHTYVAWNWDMGADTPTGFGVVTSKGNATNKAVGDVGFSPDLVWNATRSANQNKFIYDRIRGPRNEMRSNTTHAEGTNDGVVAFEEDGFRRGSSNDCNENNVTYVDWCWDMGGTSATNTSGSITSTVMANPTYGQSIVSYVGNQTSGATVGHGLSSAPEMMIIKNRSQATDWIVYHSALGNTKHLRMNSNSSEYTSATRWNNTTPSSTVFTLGNDSSVNGDVANQDFIAYCFHSVSGYSKIGTYSGDGSSDGSNAVNCGFRPAFVMIKCTNDTENWWIWDNVRNPFNGRTQNRTAADTSNTETTNVSTSADNISFTSTGFELTGLGGGSNQNGNTYVYYAVAGGLDSITTFNETGTLHSRVKANPTYGQSIVTYKGNSGNRTIGHGLSSAPEVIIAKNRSSAQEWLVYHHSLTDAKDKYLRLDTTAAVGDNTFWNDTAPTSSVFSVGDSQPINSGHGNEYFAYCFHSVTGYSKFGSFTGNGGSQTITTGFRPAFLLLKRSSNTSGWYILDNTRSPTNPAKKNLSPNESSAESTASSGINFTDTGFQENGFINDNGQTVIYMAFADKREYAYWLDQSGNNNDWTSNNLTETDISVDSPTNNFATLNFLDRGGTLNLKHGALHYQSTLGMTRGTMAGNANDKFYLEYLQESNITGSNPTMIGIGAIEDQPHHESNHRASVMCHLDGNSQKRVRIFLNNSQVQSTDFNALVGFNAGDILQFAYDGTSGKVWVGLNGNWLQGNPATGTSPIYTFSDTSKPMTAYVDHAGVAHAGRINFGQDSSFGGAKVAQGFTDANGKSDFYYEPPSGFLALSSANLKDAGIKPAEHFNTLLYTGNDATGRSLTGVGFTPSFIWFKERNNTAHHVLHDAVRGASGGRLSSNRSNVEDASNSIASFDSDGFTVGASAAYINSNNANIAAFNWKANGSGSSNSNGSITSTVSANTDAGFSVVSYTGTGSAGTIGHGLSKQPELMLVKNRDKSWAWRVFVKDTTTADGQVLTLNLTNAKETLGGGAAAWDVSEMSSSVIGIGSYGDVNNSGDDFIAYVFHSVDGYSKVGYYTGNINNDGSFVYTGFAPAWIMLKPTTRTGHWMITNNKSTPDNVVNKVIFANDSAPEYTNPTAAVQIDYLSNGFKLRTNDDNSNGDADTYVYLAFAEIPFKYSNGQ